MILVYYLDGKVGLLVLAEVAAEDFGSTGLLLDIRDQVVLEPSFRAHFACGRLFLLCFEPLRGMEGQRGVVVVVDKRCGQYAVKRQGGGWRGRGGSIVVEMAGPREERNHCNRRKGFGMVEGDHRGQLVGQPSRIPVGIRSPASP